jgi:hypothetical protein
VAGLLLEIRNQFDDRGANAARRDEADLVRVQNRRERQRADDDASTNASLT